MRTSPVIALMAAAVALIPSHADAAAYVATSSGLDVLAQCAPGELLRLRLGTLRGRNATEPRPRPGLQG